MVKISNCAMVFASFLFFAAAAEAKEFQSLESLDQQLATYLEHRDMSADSVKGPIDRRLKLEKCNRDVSFRLARANLVVIGCEALGWRISVPLRNNAYSKIDEDRQQIIVQRGQPVQLVIVRNGFKISRQMLADRSGSLGDYIPVRSSRRAQPIIAQITGPGRITIGQ